jgi:HK97 family phage major capsid protein
MELTLEMLQAETAKHQAAVEGKVKELLLSSSEESKKQLTALQGELDNMKKAQDEYIAQERAAKAMQIPGYDKKEQAQFSIGAYVGALYREADVRAQGHRNPWLGAEYELEACKAYDAHLMELQNKGIIAKANEANDGSAGGFLIPPDQTNEIVDLAIASMPIMNMGVTVLRGLVGDLPVPNISSRPTSYWVGETTAPTESQAAFGMKYLRPRKVGAFTKQSNRLIYQSRGVSDAVIKKEIARSLALKLEDGYINGTGTDYQPLGIMNASTMTTSSVSLGTNGGRFRIDDAAKQISDLEDVNELQMSGTFGWLMNPRIKNGMKRERSTQYSGQSANAGLPILWMSPLLTDKVLEDLLGYKIGSTSIVSKAETTGTSTTTSSVIFGNWTQFWIGMWRDFVLKVSDVAGDGSTGSAFLQDQMYIVGFQEVDCLAMRPSAFTKATGA